MRIPLKRIVDYLLPEQYDNGGLAHPSPNKYVLFTCAVRTVLRRALQALSNSFFLSLHVGRSKCCIASIRSGPLCCFRSVRQTGKRMPRNEGVGQHKVNILKILLNCTTTSLYLSFLE